MQHLVHLATAGHMLETGDMDDNVALYVEATASPVRRPAIRLSREHMQCLLPNSMLNDEVINIYSNLLHQETARKSARGHNKVSQLAATTVLEEEQAAVATAGAQSSGARRRKSYLSARQLPPVASPPIDHRRQ